MLSRIDLIVNTFADSAYRNHYAKSWMRDL